MYGIPTHIEHLGMFNSGAEQKKLLCLTKNGENKHLSFTTTRQRPMKE